MPSITQLLSPTDLQAVSSLQVLARSVVEGFCSGLHRSPHKGFSVEFAQHRSYVPGDDIRKLDWKIFGRSDRLYIREYEEETNLRATILLDTSGSMGYNGASNPGLSKLQYAIRLAACLSYLMLGQRDSVGLVTFDTKIRHHLPPRSRTSHLDAILTILSSVKPGGETALPDVLHDLVPRLHRRGLLILLSDCFGPVEPLISALAHFRHVHQELIVYQVWDRDELEFPFQKPTRFESLENPQDVLQVDPAQLRAAYMANLKRFRDGLLQGCHRHRIDLAPITTDEPYAAALAKCLRARAQRA
jgi:uncharacterized protein (DUF58 family)